MNTPDEQEKKQKYDGKIKLYETFFLFFNEKTLQLIEKNVKDNYYVNSLITPKNPKLATYDFTEAIIFNIDNIEYIFTQVQDVCIEKNDLEQENQLYDIIEICNKSKITELDFTDAKYNNIIKIHTFLAYFYHNNVLKSNLISVDKLNKFSKNYITIALNIIKQIDLDENQDPMFDFL